MGDFGCFAQRRKGGKGAYIDESKSVLDGLAAVIL